MSIPDPIFLTVTLNPALDKTLFLDENAPGVTIRARRVVDLAGGKGINVARALRRLGAQVRSLMPLGGWSGRETERLAEVEGLHPRVVPIAGTTRLALTLREEGTGRTWHYLEPGPSLMPDEQERLRTTFATSLAECTGVAISGGLPCPEVEPLLGWMVERAREAGVRVVLDTHGPALRSAASALPWLVKPTLEELEAWAGRPLPEEAEQWAALTDLVARGPEVAVLSRGPGAVLARWRNARFVVRPPAVAEVNTLGSGDAMVAGILWASVCSEDPAEILRWGVACGAANAAVWDPGGIERESVEPLLGKVRVEPG
ncbi:MAG: 1-phosphofructokinase family hexose kinase [Armatimonadetes bacterium]|nr:1-phosphofructokinase family hexose kinase [Armatimonadota bacterium]